MNTVQARHRILALLVSAAVHGAIATTVIWFERPLRHELGGRQVANAATEPPEPLSPVDSQVQSQSRRHPQVTTWAWAHEAELTTESRAGVLLNHLWQSTIFALGAGLLTIAFRRNRADVRYWLWFGSSVKLLVPLSLVTALSSPTWLLSVPVSTVLTVWACGFLAMSLMRLRLWRRIRAAVRASTPLELHGVAIPANVEVRSTPGVVEPCVVGWRRRSDMPVTFSSTCRYHRF